VIALPSLPRCSVDWFGEKLWADYAVREIQRNAIAAALERAAQICEQSSGPIEIYNRAYPYYLDCAAKIRALKEQQR
jgi:hypothetical protein